MDPASLVTISGLLGLTVQFLQERRGRSEKGEVATVEEYKEWLRRSEHQAVLSRLDRDAELAASLHVLLNQRSDQIDAQIKRLEENLSVALARLDNWSPLARGVAPAPQLSEQAVWFLRTINEHNASGMLELPPTFTDGVKYLPIGGSANIDPLEPRFIKDDLDQLVMLGLLTLESTPSGGRQFHITRAGARVGGMDA